MTAQNKLADVNIAELEAFFEANIPKPRQRTYAGKTFTMGPVGVDDLAGFVLEDPSFGDELMGMDESMTQAQIILRLVKKCRPVVGKMIAASAGYRDHPAFVATAARFASMHDGLVLEMLSDALAVSMPQGFAAFFGQLQQAMASLLGAGSPSPAPDRKIRAASPSTRSSSSSSKRRR